MTAAGSTPPACAEPGWAGFLEIEERVRLLHGTVEIESHTGRGTRVRVAIPTAG